MLISSTVVRIIITLIIGIIGLIAIRKGKPIVIILAFAGLIIMLIVNTHIRDSSKKISIVKSESQVAQVSTVESPDQVETSDSDPDFEQEATMTFLGDFYCTGYTPDPSENGGWNTTYDGKLLWDVVDEAVAVDPSIIPIGKQIYIEGIGYRTARDIGGAIKGNRLDILVNTTTETYECTGNYKVYIVD